MAPKKPAPKRARASKPRELDNRELQDLVASLGFRLVPKNATTQIEELERRFDLLASSAAESFKSTKDSNKLIAGFSADLIPLMNDIRGELTDHRRRLTTLERSHSSHDGRLIAIEALVFKKDK